ncbi:ATP-binding protein [Lentzea nigeriaca]|uniref:ATP-binding protein n=1 Tax=Lentzea nigeriaca TaxID=1128665 RepID=UPI0019574307|nr:ATP-binding protein [Lentzea nigeriaca]MBM7859126.1 signal transduction histidine kinase [Lentzea nigeriaca]
MSSGQSFRRLLALTFGPLVAVVLVLLALGAEAVTTTASSMEELTSRVVPMRHRNAELRGIVLDSALGLRGYTFDGDPELREAYDRGRESYVRTKDELVRLAATDERQAAARVAELADRWFATTAGLRAVPPGTADDVSERLADSTLVLDEFLDAGTRLAEMLDATTTSLRQRGLGTRRDVMLVLISCGAVAVVLAAASAMVTAQRLGRSIAAFRNTVTKWATGDGQARIPEQGIAEFQEVARSINKLADEAAKLYALEQERQRHREIAADIGLRIREHLDVDTAVGLATAEIGQHFDAERVCVWLSEGAPEDTSADLVALDWHRPELASLRSTLGEEERVLPVAPLRRLYADHRCLEVNDAEEAANLGLPVALHDRAVLVLPLGRGESVLGALVLARPGAGWTAAETDALEHIAADLSHGLDQARLYQEQQLLVRELRALDRSKSEFVSTVSHELRTPMTSIAGYVELLRDGDAGKIDAAQRKMLDVIHRNMTRLRGLIEELLLLAKLESDTVTMAEKPVDVGELVDGVVEALRPAADVGGVHLDHENAGALVVCGDAAQLDRVLTNLVSNAVKFTPAGGDVWVTSRRCADDWVEVKVSDTGIGVPKTEQHAMFTRFFRASNATEQAIPGSGLGLAIVRQIVRRHGGQVSLTSTEGAGTTVTVLLPDGRTGGTS